MTKTIDNKKIKENMEKVEQIVKCMDKRLKKYYSGDI